MMSKPRFRHFLAVIIEILEPSVKNYQEQKGLIHEFGIQKMEAFKIKIVLKLYILLINCYLNDAVP